MWTMYLCGSKRFSEWTQSSKSNISEHIKHIFEEGGLSESSVVRKFRTTAADGKSYEVKHYNLDVIISVSYRVKSLRGTQFRIRAIHSMNTRHTKSNQVDDLSELEKQFNASIEKAQQQLKSADRKRQ